MLSEIEIITLFSVLCIPFICILPHGNAKDLPNNVEYMWQNQYGINMVEADILLLLFLLVCFLDIIYELNKIHEFEISKSVDCMRYH